MTTKLTALAALLFLAMNVWAQNQKEVYGSFEAGCKVYDYHFKQASNHINAFTINEVGKTLSLLNLEQKKLEATFSFFAELEKKLADSLQKESTSAEDKQKIQLLQGAFTVLKLFADDASKRVDSLRLLATKKSQLDSLVTVNLQQRYDTLIRRFLGEEPENNLYTVTNILTGLHDLLAVLKGRKAAEYTYFNEFRQDVFENVFKSYMRPLEPSFSPVCSTDINRLAAQVFGSIKARLDFFDDEPVTAYLKLKGKQLVVYISEAERKRTAHEQEKALQKRLKKVEATLDQETEKKMGAAVVAEKKAAALKTKLEEEYRLLKNALLGEAQPQQKWAGYKRVPRLVEGSNYLLFDVENVTVEFEDGNIKNIFIDLLHTTKHGEKIPVRFRNNIPVSVSNKFDAEAFENHLIYAGKACEVYRLLRNRGVISSGPGQLDEGINSQTNCEDLFFLLSDLMEYLVVAENDKEDYSPANKVYELNEQNPVQQLKKEKRSKILLLKAYTDFVGIDDDQPNGLIQFEASRRVNLLTSRRQVSRTNYHGFFTFLEPRIVFSKLEQNNKYLFLHRQALDSVLVKQANSKVFKVNPLQLYQYANFSIQTDFNLYKLNLSNAKSNFQLNTRFGFLRTAVSDSINVVDSAQVASFTLQTDNINSRLVGLSLTWEFKPDSRYGLSLGWEVQHVKTFSDNYALADGHRKVIHTFYFDSYLNTNNEGGRLFFRTRFNQLWHKWNRNFMQVQLGYAVNIFKAQ
jgi:hypothetical protein